MPQHLSYHITTHQKDKVEKFTCSYPGCTSSFRQKWILRDHEKTHLNIYKFYCTYEGCDKKYNTRSNLEVHLRKHEGIRPFKCEKCGKQYISKWNMAKHQKKGCDATLQRTEQRIFAIDHYNQFADMAVKNSRDNSQDNSQVQSQDNSKQIKETKVKDGASVNNKGARLPTFQSVAGTSQIEGDNNSRHNSSCKQDGQLLLQGGNIMGNQTQNATGRAITLGTVAKTGFDVQTEDPTVKCGSKISNQGFGDAIPAQDQYQGGSDHYKPVQLGNLGILGKRLFRTVNVKGNVKQPNGADQQSSKSPELINASVKDNQLKRQKQTDEEPLRSEIESWEQRQKEILKDQKKSSISGSRNDTQKVIKESRPQIGQKHQEEEIKKKPQVIQFIDADSQVEQLKIIEQQQNDGKNVIKKGDYGIEVNKNMVPIDQVTVTCKDSYFQGMNKMDMMSIARKEQEQINFNNGCGDENTSKSAESENESQLSGPLPEKSKQLPHQQNRFHSHFAVPQDVPPNLKMQQSQAMTTNEQRLSKTLISKSQLKVCSGLTEYNNSSMKKDKLKNSFNINNNDLKVNMTDPKGVVSHGTSQFTKKINQQIENHQNFFFPQQNLDIQQMAQKVNQLNIQRDQNLMIQATIQQQSMNSKTHMTQLNQEMDQIVCNDFNELNLLQKQLNQQYVLQRRRLQQLRRALEDKQRIGSQKSQRARSQNNSQSQKLKNKSDHILYKQQMQRNCSLGESINNQKLQRQQFCQVIRGNRGGGSVQIMTHNQTAGQFMNQQPNQHHQMKPVQMQQQDILDENSFKSPNKFKQQLKQNPIQLAGDNNYQFEYLPQKTILAANNPPIYQYQQQQNLNASKFPQSQQPNHQLIIGSGGKLQQHNPSPHLQWMNAPINQPQHQQQQLPQIQNVQNFGTGFQSNQQIKLNKSGNATNGNNLPQNQLVKQVFVQGGTHNLQQTVINMKPNSIVQLQGQPQQTFIQVADPQNMGHTQAHQFYTTTTGGVNHSLDPKTSGFQVDPQIQIFSGGHPQAQKNTGTGGISQLYNN